MKSLVAPFDAYKGDEPYIFVSYAHRNSEIVFRHITRLKEEGYRIWYDEGIDPGTDWSDAIARALAKATTFIVFVSPEMVESHNVKKEIVFALSRKKHMIAVHIAETVLPDGLDMQLSNIQALLENRFNDREKFYERLFAALPPETKEKKISEKPNPPVLSKKPNTESVSRKPRNLSYLLKWVIPVTIVLVIVAIATLFKKEWLLPGEYPIAQSEVHQYIVEEEGVVSFSPSGTLAIRTVAGEEFNAILNTVSGLPVSFYKDGNEHKFTLDTFTRVQFTYQKKDDFNKLMTIRMYDEKNKEAVFIEDYELMSYSGLGTISFLTDKGMRFLSLNHVEEMTKKESLTPEMPKNCRSIYFRAGGMVYKIPQPLLKYEYRYYSASSDYYGIPYSDGDMFTTSTLKYIRICKEADGFGYENVYANVYFTDNSMISTRLLSGFLNAPTTLGAVRSQVSQIDDIFFGNFDVDFAEKVATDVWDSNIMVPFTGKGTATVYKTDGTSSVFALNTLGAIGGGGGSGGGYFSKTPTSYLNIPAVNRTENGFDAQLLFFLDIKSLSIKKNSTDLIAEYLLYSRETGEKHIPGFQLEGLTEKGKERIDWINIEKIDFDKKRNIDLSQLKKAIITDKKGRTFEPVQSVLYFGYSASWGAQTVNIAGGLLLPYDKIKKIEFLPTKQEGDKTQYPVKIMLQAGTTQELMLDIGGYYNDFLQFLTSLGGFSLNLRNDIQSIEFM